MLKGTHSLQIAIDFIKKDYHERGNKHNNCIVNGVCRVRSKSVESLNLGAAKDDLKDFTGAIADYSKAIEIDPEGADAYYYRGLVKLILGQKDSGCLDLSKAGELGYSEAYEQIDKFCQ